MADEEVTIPERGRWAGSPATTLEEAARCFGVRLDETARLAARRLPLRFPADYLALADPADPLDPIRAISWPRPEELAPDPDATDDPVGEDAKRLHRLVLLKYPDRALLLVTTRCHVYCRFCFRAGAGREPRPRELHGAVEVIAQQPGIREVILSGGDPLVLQDDALARLLASLARVPELRTVRIHTRAVVHDPSRVTPQLASTLVSASPRPLWMVLHVAHPRELTPGFDDAIGALHAAGIPLLSQTVLLQGINDDAQTLVELFGGLYERRVRPLYLHHPDRIPGTAHFRLSTEEGQAITRRLRGRLPGPAIPTYVIDRPDGSGKIPVDWL